MPNARREKDYVDEWRNLWEADLEAIAFNGATCDPTRVDPKVLQWVKNNCVEEPHFIKIVNATASHGWCSPYGARSRGRHQCKLFVPQPFVRKHFKKLGRVVILENGITHEKWKVSFGVPKKVASWLQGWKRVATGNKLVPGDVMVFVLVENSRFLFHVFDEHGQPKLKAHGPTVKNEPTSTLQQENGHLPDAECTLRGVKKRRLFAPEDVKPEPRTIHQLNDITAINSAAEALEDHRDDLFEKSTAGRPEIGTGVIKPLPNSDLTVSDLGEEMVTAGWCKATAQQNSEDGDEELVKLKVPDEKGMQMKLIVKEEIMDGRVLHLESAPVQEVRPDPFAFCIKSRRRVTTTVERKRARDVAKAHAKRLVGYRFLIVMSAAQVYQDFHVPLPEQFVTDTSLPMTLTRFRVEDSSGRSWKMYSQMYSSGGVAFYRKHWGVFSLEHLLEEGDVCLFQLKSKDDRTMSVRIFRVIQLPKFKSKTNFSIHDHYDMRVKKHHNSDH